MGAEKKRVIGLGAGGHAEVMLDMLSTRSDVEVVGLVERDSGMIGKQVCGVPVIGTDADLARLCGSVADWVFIGVGALQDVAKRGPLFEQAVKVGFDVMAVTHRLAFISERVQSGRGVAIMAGAIINTGVVLGDNVLINSGAIVEHHCRIGDHSHVASGAILAGGVEIGRNVLIGAGAVVRQYIKIGDGAVIGAGAVVVKDVASNQTVVGVPARPL